MSDTLYYRMHDLVRLTELPASTIRFYFKEGLLPDPTRPTPNSALYTQVHLVALNALKRLRQLAPELPLAQLKRVLDLIDQGVETEVALSLHRSVSNGTTATGASESRRYDMAELATCAKLAPSFIATLLDAGILVPAPGYGGHVFDQADFRVVQMLGRFDSMLPDGIETVARVARLLREASALEMSIRNSATGGRTPAEAAVISGELQDSVNFWHCYLFSRLRLTEIAEHGLGATCPPETSTDD